MTAAASESVASVSPRTTTMLLLALAILPLVAPFASTPTHHHGDHDHDWTIEVAHDHSQDHAGRARCARRVRRRNFARLRCCVGHAAGRRPTSR